MISTFCLHPLFQIVEKKPMDFKGEERANYFKLKQAKIISLSDFLNATTVVLYKRVKGGVKDEHFKAELLLF